jgi:hypothetical protein
MSRPDLDTPLLDRGIELVDYDPLSRQNHSREVQAKRRDPLARMMRFYRTAKRTAWDIDELPWDEAPVPRFESERWNLLWSSVVQQQLQADQTAVAAASRLLLDVPDTEARLYYTTMVQDEARHLEGWTRLADMLQPVDAFNPYFEELSQMLAESEMIEERVLVFQVLFEGCALEAFREISKATEKTILGAMANKLLVDDAIHHRSGVTYEEHLLSKASPSMKRHLSDVLKNYTPVYVANLQWRPPVRQWLSRTLAEHDKYVVDRNKALINRAMTDLGLAAAF